MRDAVDLQLRRAACKLIRLRSRGVMLLLGVNASNSTQMTECLQWVFSEKLTHPCVCNDKLWGSWYPSLKDERVHSLWSVMVGWGGQKSQPVLYVKTVSDGLPTISLAEVLHCIQSMRVLRLLPPSGLKTTSLLWPIRIVVQPRVLVGAKVVGGTSRMGHDICLCPLCVITRHGLRDM